MTCVTCGRGMFVAEQHNALRAPSCQPCFTRAGDRLFELWLLGRQYVQRWDKSVRVQR